MKIRLNAMQWLMTFGLSGCLLLLTVIFVVIAEMLIFMPSVANMCFYGCVNRLNTAAAEAQ